MISLNTLFRAAAWLVVVAIVFVTLGSPQYRPKTTLGHDTEHALAFLLLGLLFGLGYAKSWRAVAIAAIPAIGLLELLQFWSPGRHARLEDFAVNLATFVAAFAAAAFARHLIHSRSATADQAVRPPV